MISTEITVGDKTVIDSGFVTAFQDEQVKIKLSPEDLQTFHDEEGIDDESLTFVFEFIESKEKEVGIEVEPIDDNAVRYEIINHHNGGMRMGGVSPRMGPTEPVEVGEMVGRRLILNYQVSTREAGEGDTQAIDFFYSFYLGGEVSE
ncbi:DUF6864 domain-containing function [Natrinema sp. H-ect4]|uniref:DUF6864 domain-containing function n=1 Tax=Natrinema sp. H-ect4 TaxID=3242699 RepID=UPI0035A82C53